jgi:hypothetical protein
MMKPLVLATGAVDGKRLLSRRGLALSLTAAAAAVLVPRPARAQSDVWREYHPAGLPFRIEMPGEPKVETDEDKDVGMKSVDAQLEYEQITFSIGWLERKNQSMDQSIAFITGWRNIMQRAGMGATGEKSLFINGFPMREFSRQADDFNYIFRVVVMGPEKIQVSATGANSSIHASPAVRRFFDSFKLLRSVP